MRLAAEAPLGPRLLLSEDYQDKDRETCLSPGSSLEFEAAAGSIHSADVPARSQPTGTTQASMTVTSGVNVTVSVNQRGQQQANRPSRAVAINQQGKPGRLSLTKCTISSSQAVAL